MMSVEKSSNCFLSCPGCQRIWPYRRGSAEWVEMFRVVDTVTGGNVPVHREFCDRGCYESWFLQRYGVNCGICGHRTMDAMRSCSACGNGGCLVCVELNVERGVLLCSGCGEEGSDNVGSGPSRSRKRATRWDVGEGHCQRCKVFCKDPPGSYVCDGCGRTCCNRCVDHGGFDISRCLDCASRVG